MKIVSLTGKICCGKSSVATLFAQFDIPIIDTDHIAHKLVKNPSQYLAAIVDHFGKDFLQDNQDLNRPKLFEHILHNPTDKKWLEELLHPVIYQEVTKQITALKEKDTPYCIVMIPLLKASSPAAFLQYVINVECPQELQITRLMRRNNITQEKAMAILEMQNQELFPQQLAHYTICNAGSISELEGTVEALHRNLRGGFPLSRE